LSPYTYATSLGVVCHPHISDLEAYQHLDRQKEWWRADQLYSYVTHSQDCNTMLRMRGIYQTLFYMLYVHIVRFIDIDEIR
jgi:hypothetical protein